MRNTNKRLLTLIAFAAMAAMLSLTPGVSRADDVAGTVGEGETVPAESGKLYDKAIWQNMKLDMENNASAIYWTKELWGAIANDDGGGESRMTFQVVGSVMSNYILFTFGDLKEQSAKDARLDGPITVTNSQGQTAKSVNIHPGMHEMLPNFIAFPRFDVKGNDIIGPNVNKLTATLKFEGSAKPFSFDWTLPLAYEDAVYAAVAELERQPEISNTSEMTEDELMSVMLAPTMRVDIETGIVAFHLKPELLKAMVDNKLGKMNTPEAAALIKKVIANNDCFMLMDPSEDLPRLKKVVKTAKGVKVDGKIVEQDTKTYELIMKTAKPDMSKAMDLVVFPKLGTKGTIAVRVMEPGMKKQAVFRWKRD